MLDTIQTLIQQHDLCVLATAGKDGPHTSLMAYTCSPDCSEIYLVTSRNSRKYRNICQSPKISLMVDTRSEDDHAHIRALTISGLVKDIDDAQKLENVRHLMLARHPQLSDLIHQQNVALICIHVDSFQLLDGIHQSYHVKPPQKK